MSPHILAFVGSYAEAAGPGLYVCAYDEDTGGLSLLDQVSGLKNPTFLDVDPKGKKLYALEEITDRDGVKRGGAAAYAIDPDKGSLQLLNREAVAEAPVCHITLDKTGNTLFLASYHGGCIGVAPVVEEGRIGGPVQSVRHTEASGVLPAQSQPRVHSVNMDAANRYAVVCDLGGDRVVVYRYDAERQQLVRNSEVRTAPGAGPRHFAFHPSGAFGYVINELNSTVTAYRYDGEAGTLTEIQTAATLPESYAGENGTADIHVSPDGRYLYGSNRGHDSIVVYAIDGDSGGLTVVEHVHTGGGHPRNFGLSPDGRFLLAANRDGDNIVTFARDAQSGRLTPTGRELKLSKPVCIRFMEVQ